VINTLRIIATVKKSTMCLLLKVSNLPERSRVSNSEQYSEETSGDTMDGRLWQTLRQWNAGGHEPRRLKMLWTIFVILGILWLLGFSFHVGGGLIHLLLVIAVVVLIFNLLSGRRSA